ncbi:MAG: penicillin-binding protein activator LpoB [Deltaproteobacteria bacterium]|nr:penicillin-binding protein activator LpoB [Deltaproteobacteria bacterium]
MNQRALYTLAASTLLLTGCATTRTVRGEYADPEVIEILSDHFSENDLQLIANRMASSLANAPYFAAAKSPPRLLVGKIANRTQERIDTDMLAERIQVALVKSGRFELFDERTRMAMAQEYEYQQSGYVNPQQAKGPGTQIAADYILTGSLAAIVQASGGDKMTYYKMSMSASELATGIVRWADDKEIRKKFEVSGISPGTSKVLKAVGVITGVAVGLTGLGLVFAGEAQAKEGTPAGWHFEHYQCTSPTGNPWECTRTVDDPAVPATPPNWTLVGTGAGLMVGGAAIAILSAVLIPKGNPQLASITFVPSHGGGTLALSGSF